MKKTLASLLAPDFDHYRSIGELARTLQFLKASAVKYSISGRTGPDDTLADYHSCINRGEQAWHSHRITAGPQENLTTWQQNHDSMYRCILQAICVPSKWLTQEPIHLHMMLKFPMAYQHQGEEKVAWEAVRGLHKYKLPVKTLNNQHRAVNHLIGPEIVVNSSGVYLRIGVTDYQELRESKSAYSSWYVHFLARCNMPKWNPHRETFSKFLHRAVEFYKNIGS